MTAIECMTVTLHKVLRMEEIAETGMKSGALWQAARHLISGNRPQPIRCAASLVEEITAAASSFWALTSGFVPHSIQLGAIEVKPVKHVSCCPQEQCDNLHLHIFPDDVIRREDSPELDCLRACALYEPCKIWFANAFLTHREFNQPRKQNS